MSDKYETKLTSYQYLPMKIKLDKPEENNLIFNYVQCKGTHTLKENEEEGIKLSKDADSIIFTKNIQENKFITLDNANSTAGEVYYNYKKITKKITHKI